MNIKKLFKQLENVVVECTFKYSLESRKIYYEKMGIIVNPNNTVFIPFGTKFVTKKLLVKYQH